MEDVNWATVLLGAVMAGYGGYTYVMRKNKSETFWKLAPMKKFYGEKWGYVIHFTAYTVIPFILGIFCILGGVKGVRIF
jgi:hypothetical protein